jgi:hypothetical protein
LLVELFGRRAVEERDMEVREARVARERSNWLRDPIEIARARLIHDRPRRLDALKSKVER